MRGVVMSLGYFVQAAAGISSTLAMAVIYLHVGGVFLTEHFTEKVEYFLQLCF